MTRPIVSPDWATDTNYAAGGNPWSGQPTKVSPGGLVATGLVPQAYFAAQHYNYMLANHAEWINFLDGQQTAARASFVRVNWLGWSTPIGANDAYCDGFHVAWTGATAPVLNNATSGYPAASVTITAPLNTNATLIATDTKPAYGTATQQLYFDADVMLSAAGANNVTVFIAIAKDLTGNFAGAMFTKASTDTNWQCKTNDGAATTTTNSGVPPVGATFQNFKIYYQGISISGGRKVLFYINNALVATHTTNLDSTNEWQPKVEIVATANNAITLQVGGPALQWNRS